MDLFYCSYCGKGGFDGQCPGSDDGDHHFYQKNAPYCFNGEKHTERCPEPDCQYGWTEEEILEEEMRCL